MRSRGAVLRGDIDRFIAVYAWSTWDTVLAEQEVGVFAWVRYAITVQHLLQATWRARVRRYTSHARILTESIVAAAEVCPPRER